VLRHRSVVFELQGRKLDQLAMESPHGPFAVATGGGAVGVALDGVGGAEVETSLASDRLEAVAPCVVRRDTTARREVEDAADELVQLGMRVAAKQPAGWTSLDEGEQALVDELRVEWHVAIDAGLNPSPPRG
jgi:hypothetical protein